MVYPLLTEVFTNNYQCSGTAQAVEQAMVQTSAACLQEQRISDSCAALDLKNVSGKGKGCFRVHILLGAPKHNQQLSSSQRASSRLSQA